MQIFECINTIGTSCLTVGGRSREQDASLPRPDGATSGPGVPDAPITREQGIDTDALNDVQNEEDPEGYGFGV